MGGDQSLGGAVIAVGIGCRRDCPAAEIVGLVRDTLALLPASASGPVALFTVEDKRGELGLAAAALALGLPLGYLERTALRNAAPAAVSRSRRVEELFGVPSVAETAALAGAGAGATLLVARRATAAATCAVAGTIEAGASA